MTAQALAPKRVDAGDGWQVERRDGSTWCVYDADGRLYTCFNTRREALAHAAVQAARIARLRPAQ